MKIGEIQSYKRLTVGLLLFLMITILTESIGFSAVNVKNPQKEYFILIDTSLSMVNKNRLQPLKKMFLEQFIPQLQPNTILHLYAFSRGIVSSGVFHTDQPVELKKAREFISNLDKHIDDKTFAWSSLEIVLQDAFEKKKDERWAQVILYSDGEDNEGLWYDRNNRLVRILEQYKAFLSGPDMDRFALLVFTLGYKFDAALTEIFEDNQWKITEWDDPSHYGPPVILRFSWDPIRPEINETVKFYNLSEPVDIRKNSQWIIQDGTSGSKLIKDVDPDYVFTKADTYNIKLQIGQDLLEKQIQVFPPNEPLKAEFSMIPEEPVAGEDIQFINLSKGKAVKFIWRIDGRVVESENFIHRFLTPGDYTVSLKVFDAGSLENEIQKTISVNTPPPPDVKIIVSNKEPEVNQEIQFMADITGVYDSIQWDFGDGTTSDSKYPKHTFDTIGEKVVALSVNHYTGSVKKEAPVSVQAQLPPRAEFEIQGDKPYKSFERIIFVDKSEGNIKDWHWDFGDGQVAMDNIAFHSYHPNQKTKYNITLSVSGPGGTAKTSKTIEVIPGFKAEFEIDPPQGQMPLNGDPFVIQTRNLSTGSNIFYSWDFGDGSPISHEFEPKHKYQEPGNYIVSLEAKNQETGESLAAPTFQVEVVPNHQIRDAIIADIIIAGVLFALWIAWFAFFRQPKEKRVYNFSRRPFNKISDVIIGAGWKGRMGKHDLPLPVTSDFGPDFARLLKSPGYEDIECDVLPNGALKLKVEEPSTLTSVKDGMSRNSSGQSHTLTVREYEPFLIDQNPYFIRISDDGEAKLIRGWSLLAEVNGLGRLKLYKNNKETVFQSLDESIALHKNDTISMGDHSFSVDFDETNGNLFLVNESFQRRYGVLLAGLISLLLLLCPGVWVFINTI